jgi:hypothetical protein
MNSTPAVREALNLLVDQLVAPDQLLGTKFA